MTRYRSFLFDNARWDGFTFRDDDIVLSIPTKCGTTWMQMICALLIFQTDKLDRPLGLLSPWVDALTRSQDDIFQDLDAQTHRRFIKTHTPLDGLVLDERITYLSVGRDPRDVGFSFSNHRVNMEPAAIEQARARHLDPAQAAEQPPERLIVAPTEQERFWAFVDGDAPPTEVVSTLRATLHHLDSVWRERNRPNVALLHYQDLQDDLEGQMRALAARLGIVVPESRWPELIDAARFDRMRDRADDLAPEATAGMWKDNERFFHKGTSGQWQGRLDDADLLRYDRRVTDLCEEGVADPALAQWVHREP